MRTNNDSDSGNEPTKTAWISAVLDLWEESGHAAVSARTLAEITRLPNSGIFYHFGTIEQLYLAAQEIALAAAAAWIERQLEGLADLPPGADVLAPVFALFADDWCETERRIAFAWRECQLLAARDSRFAGAAAAWRKLWEQFWTEICGRLGMPNAGLLTARIFDGESLFHMLRWRRPVDRAALDETCRGWSAWLGGAPMPSSPWRDFARSRAKSAFPDSGPQDEALTIIGAAAAALLGRGGVANVTHRAVASEAGLTLGAVSYRFRTSADLLGAAFEHVHRRGILSEEAEPERIALLALDRPKLVNRYASWPAFDEGRSARMELTVAAMRNPGLAPFAAWLRYMRGKNSLQFLQAMAGANRQIGMLDAAVFANFVTGQRSAHAGMGAEERRENASAEMMALLSHLDSRHAALKNL